MSEHEYNEAKFAAAKQALIGVRIRRPLPEETICAVLDAYGVVELEQSFATFGATLSSLLDYLVKREARMADAEAALNRLHPGGADALLGPDKALEVLLPAEIESLLRPAGRKTQ